MQVEVIVETRTFGKGIFTYGVSEELTDKIEVGSIVDVPFGKKKIRGIVSEIQKSKFKNQPVSLGVSRGGNDNFKVKNVNAIGNFIIPELYIKVAKWVSEYYLCSLGEAISLFLPPEFKNPRNKKSFDKLMTPSGQETIIKQIPNFKSQIPKLNKLSTSQQSIFEKLSKQLSLNDKKPALIFGVTGSGKTEIYLYLAKKTIEMGKSVVLLVPEIILTPQNVERFLEIFPEEVCLMHSNLSKSERFFCWQDFYTGKKKIIIGPRSALLVPTKNLGLIIIDEEQEESYKQEQNPRYDAVILAEKIAKELNAFLVFGSATPRIETFYKTKIGEFNLFELKGRHHALTLPTAEVVDLKDESQSGNLSPISEKLKASITQALKNKEQVLLFINRRGMSTYISCRDCGEVILCNNCEVPLVYHFDQSGDFFSCHHCEKVSPVPKFCPSCKGLKIKYFGSGVEKIESEIIKLFPKARVIRIDSKVLRNHTEYEKFYSDFKNHKFDIVIGTQILAKGFDIPNVSLVGIISADVGLHLPYFRASEKIFRLLTQVSGRSGRREKSGRTIIQSYWPNSLPVKYAANHDFIGFYNQEIEKRLKKNYPPKSRIIRVLSEGRIQNTARQKIEKLAVDLKKEGLDFLGPGVCFFHRLNGKYRSQILIKIAKLPDERISKIFSNYQKLFWDVDAIDLL